MKAIVVISEDKQVMLDRLLANGIKLAEVSRLIGVQYDTLREKLKRRARGDANWHNREKVDHRGAYERAIRPMDDERDEQRIKLFDLTKGEAGVTVEQASKITGLSESACRRELDDFCHRPARSDLEAICRKEAGYYFAIGWNTNGNRSAKTIEITKFLRGRYAGRA